MDQRSPARRQPVRLRSMAEPRGISSLHGESASKVEKGNLLALDMVGQIKEIILAKHYYFVVENPARSYL